MKNSLTLPLSVKSIIPYFQPIIGADQRSVIGYEILGRYVNHESVLSLGSYFHRDSIDIKEKCYVDRWVRTKALEVLKGGSHKQKLFFFNISPDLFTTKKTTSFMNNFILFN